MLSAALSTTPNPFRGDDVPKAALESAKIGIWDYNFDKGTVYWNERSRTIFGVPQDEKIAYDRAIEIIHPGDRDRIHQTVQHALEPSDAQSRDYEGEYRVIWPDETVRWVVARGRAYFEGKGEARRVARFTGTVQDITERKRSEKALRESEMRKSAMLGSALDCIITIDQESRIIEFNPAAERTFGYSREEVLGELMHEHIVPPHLREAHEAGMEHYLETGEGSLLDTRIEITGMRADGTEFPVELAIVPIPLEERALFTAYLRDITERKRSKEALKEAKEKAEAASRAKSEFIANMSHDIRTPLTSVIGFLDVFEEDLPEEKQRFLDLMRKGGKRLEGMLDAILDLAEVEGGQADLHPEPLDLRTEAREALQLFESEARRQGLSVEAPPASGEPVWAKLDQAALSRVLANLIGNAVKFTPAGSVQARVWAEEDRAMIQVEDTGIGIAPEGLKRVFEPFHQEASGEEDAAKGSGLGLAITRTIVEQMGGDVKVKSEVGKGSTFTLRFPRITRKDRDDASQPADEASGAALGAEKRMREFIERRDEKPRVLVVEDSSETRELLQALLEEDFELQVAARAQEALKKAQKMPCEVALLDIGLSEDLNGVDLLHALRALSGYEEVPAIACTAYARSESRARFREAGFDAFLAKPFTKERLYDALRNCLTNGF